MKNKKDILSIFIIVLIILLIVSPKNNIDACFKGILLWGKSVLPSLLPFFFLTSILASTGFVQKIGKYFSPLTSKLFKTDGISGYIYLMSIISGYPVGAKTTAELYEKGIISKGQAIKITTFTSTSGPLFIVGAVGVGMFGSAKLGYLILISHILGAFLNGIIYRNTFTHQNICLNVKIVSNSNVLEDSMFNSIKSVLIVGGYISIFYMIISMLNRYNLFYPFYSFLSLIFNCSPPPISALLNGVIEVTRGCSDLSRLALNQKQALALSTGLVSFGGISILAQAFTFLNKFNMPFKFYLLSKTTQTIISVVIAIILGMLFL